MSKQLTDEWGTPESIYNLLPDGEYFDPCPSYDQKILMSKKDGRVSIRRMHPDLGFVDGLAEQYFQPLNFINPPFSNIGPWVNKAIKSWTDIGQKTIMVIPDHTDRAWYRSCIQPKMYLYSVGFINVVWIGRQKFVPLIGQKTSQPRFGTGLLMIGFDNQYIRSIITSVRPAAF